MRAPGEGPLGNPGTPGEWDQVQERLGLIQGEIETLKTMVSAHERELRGSDYIKDDGLGNKLMGLQEKLTEMQEDVRGLRAILVDAEDHRKNTDFRKSVLSFWVFARWVIPVVIAAIGTMWGVIRWFLGG